MPTVSFGGTVQGDGASRLLAAAGSILRYRLGQMTQLAVRKQDSPILELFLRTEMSFHYANRAKELELNLRPKLEEFVRQMRSKGVEVYILPIPTKLSIEDRAFGNVLPNTTVYRKDPYQGTPVKPSQSYRSFLELPYHSSLDLYSPLKALNESGKRVFVPWDYHLSSLGIATIAKEFAVHYANQRNHPIEVSLKVRSTEPKPYLGLLLGYLRLPDWFIVSQPEFRWKEEIYDLSFQNVRSPTGSVYYLGTSQSRRLEDEGLSLPRFIEKALEKPMKRVLVDGNDLETPIRHLQQSGISFRKGDILIWELPVGNSRFIPNAIPLLPYLN